MTLLKFIKDWLSIAKTLHPKFVCNGVTERGLLLKESCFQGVNSLGKTVTVELDRTWDEHYNIMYDYYDRVSEL